MSRRVAVIPHRVRLLSFRSACCVVKQSLNKKPATSNKVHLVSSVSSGSSLSGAATNVININLLSFYERQKHESEGVIRDDKMMKKVFLKI